MPRAGQTKPAVTPRLPDQIAIGVLTRTFPPELVDRVVTQTGRVEQRQRLLPARVVLYYTLAMCLFAQVGYEEVMRLLVEGLAWARRWQGSWQVPHKSSIARARQRLGPAPLRALFVEVARPLATPATAGAWYRGWRLLALDGTTLDVPDTPANVAAFGRPGGGRGPGAFPQVRLVGLVECGTHAVVDAAMGGLHLGEGSLAPSLARSLGPGMLLLVDQGLCSLELWRILHATGAELVWRCRQDVKLEVLKVFEDGSWASELGASHPKHKRAAVRSWTTGWTILAALVSRRATGSSPPSWTPSWPRRPSCRRCIRSGGSWRPRWTSSRPTSAAPGWCYAAAIPTESARRSGRTCWSTTPSARSCTRPPCRPRSTLTGCRLPAACTSRGARSPARPRFPPRRLVRATRQAVAEALRHLLPPRRLRAVPRVVKRKMSNFPLKRDFHHHWPQPTKSPGQAVVIVARTARGP